MVATSELSVDVRGTRIRVLRGGSGSPLLFLHGANGSDGWLPIHEDLSREHDVLVPDHPGFGGSDTPEWLDGIDDLAFFYLDFVEQEGLRDLTLVGSSMGGWLAMELAVLRPAWLSRLVLVDCAGLDVPEAPIADLFTLTPAERSRLTRFRPDAPVEAPPADDETLRRMAKNQTTFARLSWQPYLVDPKLRRRLHRIDAPTLVLWGAGDRLIPVRHGEVAAAEIRGARLAVMPESGHNPLRDQPELCAREIRGLLGRG